MTTDLQHPPAHTRPGSPCLEITPGALAAVLVACWGEYPHPVHGIIGARHGRLCRTVLSLQHTTPQESLDLPRQRVDTTLEDARLDLGAVYQSRLRGPAQPTHPAPRLIEQYPNAPLLVISLDNPEEPDIRAWHRDHHHELRPCLTRAGDDSPLG